MTAGNQASRDALHHSSGAPPASQPIACHTQRTPPDFPPTVWSIGDRDSSHRRSKGLPDSTWKETRIKPTVNSNPVLREAAVYHRASNEFLTHLWTVLRRAWAKDSWCGLRDGWRTSSAASSWSSNTATTFSRDAFSWYWKRRAEGDSGGGSGSECGGGEGGRVEGGAGHGSNSLCCCLRRRRAFLDRPWNAPAWSSGGVSAVSCAVCWVREI